MNIAAPPSANGATKSSGQNYAARAATAKGSHGGLQKAELHLLRPSNVNRRSGQPSGQAQKFDSIPFQFNPKELSFSKGANWKRDTAAKAAKTTLPQFQGAQPMAVSIEIFLDATDDPNGDVHGIVRKLFTCVIPEDPSKNPSSAPWVAFHWGNAFHFVATVESVTAKFTLFRPDGTPIRASCTLSLKEVPDPSAKQNPTSGGVEGRRTHRMVEGDSLPSVAYREYGDPTKWRVLAEANAIDDPMRIRPGRDLLIPPID